MDPQFLTRLLTLQTLTHILLSKMAFSIDIIKEKCCSHNIIGDLEILR